VKKQIKLLLAVVLITTLVIPYTTSAQGWSGRWKPGFWDMWSISVNAGQTSFFGDLSLYDTDIVGKLTNESGPAFSGIFSKHFNDKFSIGGQLLYGNLKGANAVSAFDASVMELNLQGKVNLLNLIIPDNMSDFDITMYGGIGQFTFKSIQYSLKEAGETSTEDTGTPEFVYFVGMGLEYKIGDRIGINVDMSMRQAQNDKLDDLAKNDNFDYYSYVSIGVTYYIESLFGGGSKKRSGGFGRSSRGGGRMPMRRR